MNKAIILVFNGTGFAFENYEEVYQLLDEYCDNTSQNNEVKNGVIWDNE